MQGIEQNEKKDCVEDQDCTVLVSDKVQRVCVHLQQFISKAFISSDEHVYLQWQMY